jgi:hypothetical protein
VKAINELPAVGEASNLGRSLSIRCVSSVTEEDVYINKDTFFPLYTLSGGRSYSLKNRARNVSIGLGL